MGTMPYQGSQPHMKHSTCLSKLKQGDCVSLRSLEGIFQVIGVDSEHEKCWIRRWPLTQNGSPVFEIPIQQVTNK